MIIEITMERIENRAMTSPYDWNSEDIAMIVYRPIYGHVRRTGMDGLMTWIPEWGPPREVRC